MNSERSDRINAHGPELLEALKDVLYWGDRVAVTLGELHSQTAAFNRAEALVAKLEGER